MWILFPGYLSVIWDIGIPEVVKAVKEQLDSYMHLHVYGEMIQTPQVKLAALLSENPAGKPGLYIFCQFRQ